MIKILYVIDDLLIGGAEKVLLELVRGLERERFEPRIVSLHRENRFADELADAGVPVDYLPFKRSTTLSCVAALKRMVADDVQIVQFMRPLSRFLGQLATRRLRSTKVIMRYDSLLSGQSCFWQWAESMAVARADCVLAPSHAVASELEQRFGAAVGQKAEVIHNGIAPDTLTLPTTPSNGHPLTVGTIGNYSWKKGYHHGLAAVAQVRQEFPDLRYQVVGRVGGDDSELQALVKQLGMADYVEFLGELKDVRPHLNRWSIYLQPSETEGFGYAILEAMSCAKPVVATAVGGVPEIVSDEQCGLLTKPSADEMATAIIRLLRDQDQAESYGRNGKRLSETQFTARQMVVQHSAVYDRLVSPAGNHQS